MNSFVFQSMLADIENKKRRQENSRQLSLYLSGYPALTAASRSAENEERTLQALREQGDF